MSDKPVILLVDDEKPMLEWLSLLLEENGYRVNPFSNPADALRWGKENAPNVLVTDIRMPGMTGLELFGALRAHDPEVAGILITAFSSVETAVKAIREGVEDYLVKPFKADQLLLAIEKALSQRQVKTENERLRNEVRRDFDFSGIIGTSNPMLELLESVRKVADQPSTVLIIGRERHRQGAHRKGPPLQQPQGRQTLPGRKLRKPLPEPSRERTLRSREGKLHRGPP